MHEKYDRSHRGCSQPRLWKERNGKVYKCFMAACSCCDSITAFFRKRHRLLCQASLRNPAYHFSDYPWTLLDYLLYDLFCFQNAEMSVGVRVLGFSSFLELFTFNLPYWIVFKAIILVIAFLYTMGTRIFWLLESQPAIFKLSFKGQEICLEAT